MMNINMKSYLIQLNYSNKYLFNRLLNSKNNYLYSYINYRNRDIVLFYAAFCGIFKAIWYGLYEIMAVMIGQVQELAEKVSYHITD